MKIAVVGPGAMGKLFGGRLAQAGHAVTMVGVTRSTLDALDAEGITIEDESGAHAARVAAARGEELGEPQDLVLLFTKTFCSRAALESARGYIGAETTVLTLQNGLGNVELVNEFVDISQILVGVTNYASDALGPTRVRTQGAGFVRFMSADGQMRDTVATVRGALLAAGFNAEVYPDVFVAIWEKVAFNAALNSTTALCRVPCGAVGAVEEGRHCAFEIARETVRVAQAYGVDASAERVIESIRYSFVHHSGHYTSMAQDVQRGRRTEVDSINGEIVRRAEAKGIDVPYVRAVCELLKVVEASRERRI